MPHPPTDLAPGAVLSGRYRLEAPVGEGATSTVWRARDVELGRVVAVKVLAGEELSGRFEREGAILGRLSHPNIVAVHAAGHDGDHRYLVTDLVDGVALDQVLRDGPVPVDDALRLVAAIADGLGSVHAAGVVHRDVKPANIVCGRDGVPRLVDFGIARADGSTALTTTHTLIGTAAYLSPEQAQGERPGPPGDVYSLGCVLHELLTGAPPFGGDNIVTVAYRHVHEEPAPPSAAAPDVPAAVDAVVIRCLAKDPGARYADAGALAEDLRRVLAGDAPAALDATVVGAPAAAADADATVVVPAVASAASPGVDGTLVLPVADSPERIDPAPLAEIPQRHPPRWGLVAAASAAVLLVALLLASLVGGGSPGTRADAGEEPAPTTTVVTAAVAEEAPVPPAGPAGDSGGGGGKAKGQGKGKGGKD